MLFKRISMAEAAELIQKGGCDIVDVRGRDEYAEGHIPGAICIPLDEIGFYPPEELPDLKKPVLVYCASGVRSAAAAYQLEQMGYEAIYDCGGISRWTGGIVEGPEPGAAKPRGFTYVRRANYHETDQMRIIHHSNYIKWMEEARLAYLSQMGMDYAAMEIEGVYSPVVSLSVDYKRPVEFGDIVELRLTVAKYNGVTAEFGYEFFNMTKDELSAEAKSKHCFVAGGQPIVLKKRFPDYDAALRREAGD